MCDSISCSHNLRKASQKHESLWLNLHPHGSASGGFPCCNLSWQRVIVLLWSGEWQPYFLSFLSLQQGLRASGWLNRWGVGMFSAVGTVQCVVGCLPEFFISRYQQNLISGCDNQNCPQMLSSTCYETKSPWTETIGSKHIVKM